MTGFATFVRAAHAAGHLVVQPRMGFSDPALMRAGLVATRRAHATTVGTVTLDSYTRVGDYAAVLAAAAEGTPLNGYPIVTTDDATTRHVLSDSARHGFPVQVRHGSPLPGDIVDALVALGLDATEGGPVSYCLPYSRVPLRESVTAWSRSVEAFAAAPGEPHLESFGGCMLGQLCPPSLLIALTILEGLFFRRRGIASLSLSFTQQTSAEQDAEALHALRRIAADLLHDVDHHIVVYAYMGVHPRTEAGSLALLADAARLAVRGGAARLIVKTPAEAHRIPTIAENVSSLEHAAAVARTVGPEEPAVEDSGVEAEARTLIAAVLDLHEDVGEALVRAFSAGVLDVPYCLHADNAGRSRAHVDGSGRLRWSAVGSMPIARSDQDLRPVTSGALLGYLHRVEQRYDHPVLTDGTPAAVLS
ncbi:methylaspartate mutase [Saccharothrix sp. S26]|uniref:methylaspartate mutase n=1 Tax=Saccharothrix sp. S26 TaxID=2907215 RepID=UPI001F236D43|nr:methylaspartate mutase [Saccharothrix sp. S26]MCE6995125.1 methylaspartate mutase [Saccharothrix sp. S26]